MDDFSAARLVGTLAQVLNHSCAPTPEQLAETKSLRHVQAVMRANGICINDEYEQASYSLSASYVPEGWEEVGTSYLHHRTTTGRLTIDASEDRVELRFEAGPVPVVTDDEYPDWSRRPDGPGRHVCTVVLRGTSGVYNTVPFGILVEPGDISLLDGRADRLALLAELDRALGGTIQASVPTAYVNVPTAQSRELSGAWRAAIASSLVPRAAPQTIVL